MNLWSHRFSQNMNKKLSRFLPSLHWAETLTIFRSYFGRNDDFINSFWNLLTFRSVPDWNLDCIQIREQDLWLYVCKVYVCFYWGHWMASWSWCPLSMYEISYFFMNQSVVILFGLIQAHYLFVVQFLIFFKDVNNVLKVRFIFFLNFVWGFLFLLSMVVFFNTGLMRMAFE